jgi:hypothetical protein
VRRSSAIVEVDARDGTVAAQKLPALCVGSTTASPGREANRRIERNCAWAFLGQAIDEIRPSNTPHHETAAGEDGNRIRHTVFEKGVRKMFRRMSRGLQSHYAEPVEVNHITVYDGTVGEGVPAESRADDLRPSRRAHFRGWW